MQLISGERNRLGRRGTDNSEAYREYLQGRFHLGKRTGDEIVRAIDNFSRAIEQDPSFALAYAGLAECYTLVGNAGYGSLPREQAIAHARAFAGKAIALDESLAEAHVSLGYVKFRIDWDWAAAEAEFKRSLQLNPGLAKAHESYALFLAIQGRLDEAMAEMKRAQQLDPLSPTVSNGVGRILHFQRKFDAAVLQFKKTLELEPGFADAYFSMGLSYQVMGRYDEAITVLKTAIHLSGNRLVMISMLGMTQGFAGRKQEAQKTFDDLLERSQKTPVSPYYFAIVSVGLGEIDRAFQYFDQAYAERDGILIYLGVDPINDAIRPDPRFSALLKKMGLLP
ncbi:MAG: tetratricopeptide repeat protein [Opitutaceae bacterium]|nr:tetratricopeptide repeat protein [Opitutaceae bacterium]